MANQTDKALTLAADAIFDVLEKTETDQERRKVIEATRKKLFDARLAMEQENDRNAADKQAATDREDAVKGRIDISNKVAGALPAVARDLKYTILAFEKGDAFAGSAGLMDMCSTAASLLKSLAGATSLAGPFGAFASALFSIIGLVLHHFEAKQKSMTDVLEEKLRKMGAEEKGQVAQAAIDEFEALYAAYPKASADPGRTGHPLKIHHYLDSLAQGNARDNLLKSNYWLREPENYRNRGISRQWLQVLDHNIHAGNLELRNFTHLIGLADPTGSEYDQLLSVYRMIAGQHRKFMLDIRDAVRAKGTVWEIGTHAELDNDWKHGGAVFYRQDRDGGTDSLEGHHRTIAAARDSQRDRWHAIGLEGEAENDDYRPFHVHHRAYTISTERKDHPAVGNWKELPDLRGSRDVWMLPDCRIPSDKVEAEGAFVFAVIPDRGTSKVVAGKLTRDGGADPKLEIDVSRPVFRAGDGDELLLVRVMPGYVPPRFEGATFAQGSDPAAPPVVYTLLRRGGTHLVQWGNHPNQTLCLPFDNPRGIAIDESRLWVYRRVDANGEAELACLTHGQARNLQGGDPTAQRKAWKSHGTYGAGFLDRRPGGTPGAGATDGITHLSGSFDGTLLMCFNTRMYSGVVGDVDGSYIDVRWKPHHHEPARALSALKTTPEIWPRFARRLAALEKVLAEEAPA